MQVKIDMELLEKKGEGSFDVVGISNYTNDFDNTDTVITFAVYQDDIVSFHTVTTGSTFYKGLV